MENGKNMSSKKHIFIMPTKKNGKEEERPKQEGGRRKREEDEAQRSYLVLGLEIIFVLVLVELLFLYGASTSTRAHHYAI